jgi:hypothetical protein
VTILQEEGVGAMGYQQTLMYGRYSQALGQQIMQAQRMLLRLGGFLMSGLGTAGVSFKNT